KRTAPARDRRVVIIEVTPDGKNALTRVGRAAEAHLSELLQPLELESCQQLRDGLAVLRKIFDVRGELRRKRNRI
ncbi:MAG: hypothetical protein LBQ09_03120, partial [Acidobacteriaceae bacterium]|nr:hypothetical protein [Acidobacteriaceae bacterium]